MSRMSRRCGNLDLSHPYGPSRPVTGIALLTYFIINHIYNDFSLTMQRFKVHIWKFFFLFSFCRLRILSKIMYFAMSGFVSGPIHSVVTGYFSCSLLYLWLQSYVWNTRGSSVYSDILLLAVLLRQEATLGRYVNSVWHVWLRLTRFLCFELFRSLGFVVLQSGLRFVSP
jgi:hypothetical protein